MRVVLDKTDRGKVARFDRFVSGWLVDPGSPNATFTGAHCGHAWLAGLAECDAVLRLDLCVYQSVGAATLLPRRPPSPQPTPSQAHLWS